MAACFDALEHVLQHFFDDPQISGIADKIRPELAAAGKPSILVPFPYAADDHQTHNAEAMQKAGAARMVRDSELTSENLVHLIGEICPSLEKMGADGNLSNAQATLQTLEGQLQSLRQKLNELIQS